MRCMSSRPTPAKAGGARAGTHDHRPVILGPRFRGDDSERITMRTEVLLDHTGAVIASTTQDVEPILERNKALRAEPQRSDWGRHVAQIPNVLLVQWLNEEHARGNIGLRLFTREFDELVARKLADPDWAHLKTS
jgi:hypothetical protein